MDQAEASKIADKLKGAKPGAAVPPLPTKGGHNWVTRTGGLPEHIDLIARHVFWIAMKGDLSREGNAIAIAVSDCKMMCSTGRSNFGQVSGVKRAEACKAVAQWESKRAAAHVESAAKRTTKAAHTDGSEGG